MRLQQLLLLRSPNFVALHLLSPLQALTSGGGKSEAFASAIATAVASRGCGSVSNVLAQAEASAESSGKGEAFSEAVANASAQAAKCLRKLPNCSTQNLAARNCCTRK